ATKISVALCLFRQHLVSSQANSVPIYDASVSSSSPWDCLPLAFGSEPGVRKMEIYQGGSSQRKLLLCVTNVLVHGTGVKLLDGLAVAKHQWVRDLHLPLPSPSYYQSGRILGRPLPVPFCYWSGRRTVGILLENGMGPPPHLNSSPPVKPA